MKIVQVINSIITNKSKISNVLRNDSEYFFVYNSKYKWSITKSDKTDDYFIHFYPTDIMNIEQLANNQDWNSFPHYVSYKTEDLKTKEALETFRELYQIVADKVYGIDDIFNEIILGGD